MAGWLKRAPSRQRPKQGLRLEIPAGFGSRKSGVGSATAAGYFTCQDRGIVEVVLLRKSRPSGKPLGHREESIDRGGAPCSNGKRSGPCCCRRSPAILYPPASFGLRGRSSATSTRSLPT